MKKKHLIIIIAQSVVIILLVVYGLVQTTVANVARREAETQKKMAEKNAEITRLATLEAERQAEIAVLNVEEARRQAKIAAELQAKLVKRK